MHTPKDFLFLFRVLQGDEHGCCGCLHNNELSIFVQRELLHQDAGLDCVVHPHGASASHLFEFIHTIIYCFVCPSCALPL